MRISKLLSLGLRHDPSALGITTDAGGWTEVCAVLRGLAERNAAVTREELEELVAASDKQRFALSEDGERIRANQGHSIEVDLGLPRHEPPAVLFHGTVDRFLESIRREGLLRGARTHVHLSVDEATAMIVARRRAGVTLILRVRAGAMHADGHAFFLSRNGVWLTETVPPAYLEDFELLT
ncbi:MAG: RNA 2'-phosphotransferase [Labilithrix sp.]|nr:RNA 2'-phosphotransferase [Labilithrix sp.]